MAGVRTMRHAPVAALLILLVTNFGCAPPAKRIPVLDTDRFLATLPKGVAISQSNGELTGKTDSFRFRVLAKKNLYVEYFGPGKATTNYQADLRKFARQCCGLDDAVIVVDGEFKDVPVDYRVVRGILEGDVIHGNGPLDHVHQSFHIYAGVSYDETRILWVLLFQTGHGDTRTGKMIDEYQAMKIARKLHLKLGFLRAQWYGAHARKEIVLPNPGSGSRKGLELMKLGRRRWVYEVVVDPRGNSPCYYIDCYTGEHLGSR